MTPSFQGWPDDFQAFFIGLEMDNSKTYFEAHRKEYTVKVRGPMEALIAELEPEFGPLKIHRANRDLRFSKDKSPYRTNIAAMPITPGSGGYVSLDSKSLMVAGGPYQLDPSLLPKFRAAVAAEGPASQLEAIVAKLEADGFEVGGQDLKRVPPEFPPDHPRGRLLRHKRLFAWKQLGLQPWLGTHEAAGHVASAWRSFGPLNAWFASHVGSAPPAERWDRRR